MHLLIFAELHNEKFLCRLCNFALAKFTSRFSIIVNVIAQIPKIFSLFIQECDTLAALNKN